jgi:hypothetical protein
MISYSNLICTLLWAVRKFTLSIIINYCVCNINDFLETILKTFYTYIFHQKWNDVTHG